MYGPTMQCISKTHHMLQLSTAVPNICPQPESSLINHLISDDLGCWMLDQLSFRRRHCRLNSSISRTEF